MANLSKFDFKIVLGLRHSPRTNLCTKTSMNAFKEFLTSTHFEMVSNMSAGTTPVVFTPVSLLIPQHRVKDFLPYIEVDNANHNEKHKTNIKCGLKFCVSGQLTMPDNNQEILPALLDRFYRGLRKTDGTMYKLTSYDALKQGLVRFFQSAYSMDITKGIYAKSNLTYCDMRKYIRKNGLGDVNHYQQI